MLQSLFQIYKLLPENLLQYIVALEVSLYKLKPAASLGYSRRNPCLAGRQAAPKAQKDHSSLDWSRGLSGAGV